MSKLSSQAPQNNCFTTHQGSYLNNEKKLEEKNGEKLGLGFTFTFMALQNLVQISFAFYFVSSITVCTTRKV